MKKMKKFFKVKPWKQFYEEMIEHLQAQQAELENRTRIIYQIEDQPEKEEQSPSMMRKRVRRIRLRLYRDAFTVNGGQPRYYDDPANEEFLTCVQLGEVPPELGSDTAEVRVRLENHRFETCPNLRNHYIGRLNGPTPRPYGPRVPPQRYDFENAVVYEIDDGDTTSEHSLSRGGTVEVRQATSSNLRMSNSTTERSATSVKVGDVCDTKSTPSILKGSPRARQKQSIQDGARGRSPGARPNPRKEPSLTRGGEVRGRSPSILSEDEPSTQSSQIRKQTLRFEQDLQGNEKQLEVTIQHHESIAANKARAQRTPPPSPGRLKTLMRRVSSITKPSDDDGGGCCGCSSGGGGGCGSGGCGTGGIGCGAGGKAVDPNDRAGYGFGTGGARFGGGAGIVGTIVDYPVATESGRLSRSGSTKRKEKAIRNQSGNCESETKSGNRIGNRRSEARIRSGNRENEARSRSGNRGETPGSANRRGSTVRSSSGNRTKSAVKSTTGNRTGSAVRSSSGNRTDTVSTKPITSIPAGGCCGGTTPKGKTPSCGCHSEKSSSSSDEE